MAPNQKAWKTGGWKLGQHVETYLGGTQSQTHWKAKGEYLFKAFCDETADGLKFDPGMQNKKVDGTVTLITKIIEFWKIVNIKSSFEGLRLNDSLHDVISSYTDLRLDDFMEIAELAVSMAVSCQKRVRSLTEDTSTV